MTKVLDARSNLWICYGTESGRESRQSNEFPLLGFDGAASVGVGGDIHWLDGAGFETSLGDLVYDFWLADFL